MSRVLGSRIILGVLVVFCSLLFWIYNPDPLAEEGKAGELQAGWKEMVLSTEGTFYSPVPDREQFGMVWFGWESLEEFVGFNQQMSFISEGQWNKAELGCGFKDVKGRWIRRGFQKFRVACNPKSQRQSIVLIFRPFKDGLALEGVEF